MRTLAILIVALLAVSAAYQLVEATRSGLTAAGPGLGAVAVLVVGVFAGALGFWRGARWGAGLILIVALLGAFAVQQNHIFMAFGGSIAPQLAVQLPYLAWGGFALVALLIVLSWRDLGKR
jgi:hypothetical protein